MKFYNTILLLLLASLSFAQNNEQEINDQVWKPFIQALITQDPDAFMTVHSKDVVRVERDQSKILNFEQYNKNVQDSWRKWKDYLVKNKINHTFELRFLERISDGALAHEVGYYKNESTSPDGKKQIGYGKFHVVLKKENGTWKILVDSDSNEGGSITEEQFQAAKALQ